MTLSVKSQSFCTVNTIHTVYSISPFRRLPQLPPPFPQKSILSHNPPPPDPLLPFCQALCAAARPLSRMPCTAFPALFPPSPYTPPTPTMLRTRTFTFRRRSTLQAASKVPPSPSSSTLRTSSATPPTSSSTPPAPTPLQRDVFRWTRRRDALARETTPTLAPILSSSPAPITVPAAGALRYSNADVCVKGWLVKRGKRLGSRVERWLELSGSTLTNARVKGGKATWSVNVRGCKVVSGPNREIVFKVGKSFSSFFARDDASHALWLEALQGVSAVVTEFYDFGKLIGIGAYSEVFLARDQLRNELCAIKVLERADREHGKLIDRELKVLRMLDSNSLVRTCDIFDTPTQTFVVMEYLAGGELLDLITENDHLSERTAKHVLKQVILAVLYLHERGIAHRDVKPENILLASNQASLPRVKLTDFGLSRVVGTPGSSAPDILMASQCGTAYYLAPEIANNFDYGKPVDMWACGVVAFVMLAGKFPFYGDTDEKFMRRLRAGVQFPNSEWRHVSKGAKSLIRGLLDPNPENRLTASDALAHRWLQDDPADSRPHMGLDSTRTLSQLQYQAKNESISLQLKPYAPSSERRSALLSGPIGEDADMVNRTEEMAVRSPSGSNSSSGDAFGNYESDEDSRHHITPMRHSTAAADELPSRRVARRASES